MCGRFRLAGSAAALLSYFNVQESLAWVEHYNLTPSKEVLTIVQPAGAARELRRMRWGLIPSWAKDPAIGSQLINAQAETAVTKPAFRKAFRKRRCLILADAFFEWKKETRHKQPYCIRMRDGRPFAFAGLWEHWEGPEGKAIDSCTILTATPNDLLRPLHHRMAVILSPADYDPWLDPAFQDAERFQAAVRPYPPDEMEAYPVSTRVNSPANESPECVVPLSK
jgi:putative SOS response-associated peptidase YedK